MFNCYVIPWQFLAQFQNDHQSQQYEQNDFTETNLSAFYLQPAALMST